MSLRRFTRKVKRFFGAHDLVPLPGSSRIYLIVVPSDESEQAEVLSRSLARAHRQFGSNAQIVNASNHKLQAPVPVYDVAAQASPFRTHQHPPTLHTVVCVCQVVAKHLQRADGISCIVMDEHYAAVIGVCLQIMNRDSPDELEEHVVAKDYETLCKLLSRQSDTLTEVPCHLAFLERFAKDCARLCHPEPSAEFTMAAPRLQPPHESPTGEQAAQTCDTLPPVLTNPWKLKEVILHGTPQVGQSFRPLLMIIHNDNIIYNSMTRAGGIKSVSNTSKFHAFHTNANIAGDCVVRLYHVPEGRQGKIIGTFTFSTAFFPGLAAATNSWPAYRAQLRDLVCDDPSVFPQNFFIDVVFGAVDSDPNDTPSLMEPSRSGMSTAASQAALSSTTSLETDNPDPDAMTQPPHTSMAMEQDYPGIASSHQDSLDMLRRLQEALMPTFGNNLPSFVERNESQYSDPPPPDSSSDDGTSSDNTSNDSGNRSSSHNFDMRVLSSAVSFSDGESHDLGSHPENDLRISDVTDDVSVSSLRSRHNETGISTLSAESTTENGEIDIDLRGQNISDEEYARRLQAQFDEEDRRERERMRARRRSEMRSHSRTGRGRGRRTIAASLAPQQDRTDPSAAAESANFDSNLLALIDMFSELGIPSPFGAEISHVSRARVRALPRHSVSETSSLLERECQICMSRYEIEEEAITLPCLHIYHAVCAERWLMRKPTCPVCLTRIDARQQEHNHDSNEPPAGRDHTE